MAETETEHRTVATDYVAHTEGAVHSLGRLEHGFHAVVGKVEHLHEKFSEFRREQGMTTLAMLGLGYGLGSWIEKIKEVNSEFASTRKSIAGVLSSSLEFAQGTSEIDKFKESMQIAGEVTEKAEDTAARFGLQFGALEGVGTIYKKLAISAGDLGLTQKQLMDLTVETAATAKRYGVTGEMAANSIARAMRTGALRGTDEFTLSLGKAIGNMRKLTEAQRFEHISKALQGSVAVADAMSQGIGDQLTRARTQVAAFLRDLTSPLFGVISKHIGAWAKHVQEVREGGKSIVDTYAGKLVSAFEALAKVSAFIKDHWKEIATIAAGMRLEKAFAAGGMMAGVGGMWGGAIGGFANKLSTAAIALGAFKIALDALLDFIDSNIDNKRALAEKSASTYGDLGVLEKLAASNGRGLSETQAKMLEKRVGMLEKKGLIETDAAGHRRVNKEQVAAAVAESGNFDDIAGAGDTGQGISGGAEAEVSRVSNLLMSALAVAGDRVVKSKNAEELKFAKRPQVNINGGVHVTMKFEDEDPDNVFVTLRSRFEDYVDRKTQSPYSEHLGD